MVDESMIQSEGRHGHDLADKSGCCSIHIDLGFVFTEEQVVFCGEDLLEV